MKTTTSRARRPTALIMLLYVALLNVGSSTMTGAVAVAQTPRTVAATNLTVSYELGMSRPTSHLFEVTMTIANVTAPQLEVQFPVWVPGAYRIVDAARNVQEFRAGTTAGQTLPAAKTQTNTWRVATNGNSDVRVSYKVYADALGVSGMHLDDTHGYFNGTLLFPYVVGAKDRPVTLTINKPPGWTTISTGLEPVAGRPDTFTALDYDTFADCPTETGTQNVLRFDHQKVPYEIAIWGSHNYDLTRFQKEIEAMVRSQIEMMGAAPFKRYVFIFHMSPNGGGGLEHLNSTTIGLRKYGGATDLGWDSFRGVTSHEFFHLWNVKRFRPEALGPFDYTRQVPTTDLYVSEGMTSYYGDLHIRRAGLWTPARFYAALASEVQTLQGLPGRRILTVEESSVNTWFFNDNSRNSSFSYYNKGQLIGMLLDLEIRQRTGNARTLDDVFRHLNDNYALPKAGWAAGGFRKAVETIAGSNFGEFFTRYVSGTEELPYERALGYAGLKLERKDAATRDSGITFAGDGPTRPGTFVNRDPSLLTVSGVDADGPANNVLAPGDLLLAISGERATQATLLLQLERFKEGERVPLTIFRGDRLLEVSMTMTGRRAATYEITEDPKATAEQKALRESWLTGKKAETSNQ